ncbi:MAG: hypothetical protein NVS2B14_16770 [Chamaesiphon sp.]
MNINIEIPFQKGLGQVLPFLLSFSDDALLLGVSRLGFHWQWLHWLSPITLVGTLLYWTIQLVRHQQSIQKYFKPREN